MLSMYDPPLNVTDPLALGCCCIGIYATEFARQNSFDSQEQTRYVNKNVNIQSSMQKEQHFLTIKTQYRFIIQNK